MTILFVLALAVWPVKAASPPEAVVQAQVEAYNARNIDAFLATYSDDAQLFEFPDKLIAKGSTQLRERYEARFKEQGLHAEIVQTNRGRKHGRGSRTGASNVSGRCGHPRRHRDLRSRKRKDRESVAEAGREEANEK